MEKDQIKQKIKGIIGEMFEVNQQDVQEDKLFKQMANYNSMRALEFLAKLETEFNVMIDPDLLPKMESVEKSTQVIEELLRG